MDTKLAQIVKELFDIDVEIKLTRPDAQFGDYASNVALQLAKPLSKSPRVIAEEIANSLRASGDFDAVTIAGPGFINLTVSTQSLLDELEHYPQKSRSGDSVVVEVNNPNPFKDLHIGHAYNCITADTLANLLEASGAVTHRVSYHGDVGLHVGKSMWAILRYVDGDMSRLDAIPVRERPAFMSRMYVEGAAAYKDDDDAKQAIELLTKQSFGFDDVFEQNVYDTCKAWSFSYIDETVLRLGSHAVEKRYVESDADALGVATVKSQVGTVFEESDGAIVFPGEKYGLYTNVFVSSRGTGLYAARDLGLMQLKQRDFHPNKSFIITGDEQKAYFEVVIKAAELALPELSGVTKNIPTGTVKLSTGKMSSRTGDVLNIEWLFEKLHAAASERGEVKDVVIIAALRYAFLKVRIGSDIIFDINEALSIEGNSGPYLQYAHARARSILGKTTKASVRPVELDEAERLLVSKLGEYSDVVTQAMNQLAPHTLCAYLYELSQVFNRFYEKSQVVGDAREAERVYIVHAYAETLKRGLTLLGIPAPEQL